MHYDVLDEHGNVIGSADSGGTSIKETMIGMDVHVSLEAQKKVNAEDVFNANVVETLKNLGVLECAKSEDAEGTHYRWVIKGIDR